MHTDRLFHSGIYFNCDFVFLIAWVLLPWNELIAVTPLAPVPDATAIVMVYKIVDKR